MITRWGIVVVSVLLMGCASISGGGDGFTGMTKDSTPFSMGGPHQDVPDRYLDRGTRVRVVGHTDGYTRVQLVTGEIGFVPEMDVTEAPDELPDPRKTMQD